MKHRLENKYRLYLLRKKWNGRNQFENVIVNWLEHRHGERIVKKWNVFTMGTDVTGQGIDTKGKDAAASMDQPEGVVEVIPGLVDYDLNAPEGAWINRLPDESYDDYSDEDKKLLEGNK